MYLECALIPKNEQINGVCHSNYGVLICKDPERICILEFTKRDKLGLLRTQSS